jgi:DNA-directed RNA polymerase subunit beta'
MKTGILLNTHNIPYGSSIFVKDGESVAKGTVICKWDPYNGVIVSEFTGKIAYEDLEQGQSFMVEIDEQTGFQEK